MTYRAIVTLPGYDYNTSTPEQHILDSDFPPLKAKLGQSSPHYGLLVNLFTSRPTQNVTHTVYSFNHGYTYIPATLAMIILYDASSSIVATGIGYAAIGSTLEIKAYANSSQFLVTVYDNDNWLNTNYRLEVSYYVFCEDGT